MWTLSLSRPGETRRGGQCSPGWQRRSTTYFEDHLWFAEWRKPPCEPPSLNPFSLNLRADCLPPLWATDFSSLLQVWVIESSMEVVARQLLLLYLALMPQESMGLNGGIELPLKNPNLRKTLTLSDAGFNSQRRQRFTWRCLGTGRSAVKQRKYWDA